MGTRKHFAVRPTLFAVMLLAGLVGISGWIWKGAALAEERPTDSGAIAQAHGLSRAFRAAAQQVVPTVVMIKTTTKPRMAEPSERSPLRQRNPFKGTPFEDFFNDDNGLRGRSMVPRHQGVGSGVIIDPSGMILTNAHVVDDADEVLVELADGRQFKGTDIKQDEQTDLAVVRIKADKPLPAAKLGDSSKLEIGDWVLAVGNPFELEHTVSAGIISGMKRLLPSGKRADYIQTDAAINPGNSGGPLVNLEGEVIGINTAIASSSGGYQGVGFAIPINLAKWVSKQLVDRGAVERAYLGVGIAEITHDVANKIGVEKNQGVLVTEVFPDTPAARSGFQEGDVVVAFAGQSVRNPHQLQELVERAPLNSKQEVKVLREKKPVAMQVEVKSLPKKFVAATPRAGRQQDESSAYSNRDFGLQAADLTPQLAERMGYKGFSGVIITGVDEDSLAAEAGLREGMLIIRVGNKSVKSLSEFEEAMKRTSPKDGVMLLVRTEGGNRFVVLQQR